MSTHTRSNDQTEEGPNWQDLGWVAIFEAGLWVIGIISIALPAFVLWLVMTQTGTRADPVNVALFVSGTAIILSALAIRLIRKRMLERFCEIDELKTEIRELKNEWTQR